MKVIQTIGLWIMMIGVLCIMFTGLGFTPEANLLESDMAQINPSHLKESIFTPWLGAAVFFIGSIFLIIGSLKPIKT